ncbi:MAG: hypothetical protein JXQ72_00605 [Anaerolineae bacterium]|nr:hypothetical protein [Anaerolineae bacterium]
MRRLLKWTVFALIGIGSAALWLAVEYPIHANPPESVPHQVTLAPSPTARAGLPGRPTATLTPTSATAISPVVTSPFVFLSTPSPTPAVDCTTIFPLGSVESIEFGYTSVAQLEAAFGQPAYVGGRAPYYRFESEGCSLRVTVGGQEALEADLLAYGTLEFVLDAYGDPAAVGVSQGNLTLLMIGQAVLFYPEQGVIAFFEVAPEDLALDTPVSILHFRPAYEVEKQLRRLNVREVDWLPPLR